MKSSLMNLSLIYRIGPHLWGKIRAETTLIIRIIGQGGQMLSRFRTKIPFLIILTIFLIILSPFGQASSECPIINSDYEIKLPTDLGLHDDATVNTWWDFGTLYEVDNPAHKYGYLLGYHLMTLHCDNNANLLSVKFLSDTLLHSKFQEIAIIRSPKLESSAVPFSVSLDAQNYFKQTSANTFSFSQTIHDKDNVITLKLTGIDISGLRKSGKNGMEFYCNANIPEVAYPRILVEGTLTRNGIEKKVRGSMQSDRTWAGGGRYQCFFHYTWAIARLDNGMDVILYAFRDRTGAYTKDSFLNVNFPDGTTKYYSANEFKMEDSHPWTSPVTHVTYFIEGDLSIPSLAMQIHFKPLMDDCEMNGFFTLYSAPSEMEGKVGDNFVKGVGTFEIGNFITQ